MAIYALGSDEPEIHDTAYVHPQATVIGKVVIGAHASVWPHAVIRADDNTIAIGASTSVQDGAVLHCTTDHPTIVGSFCTIGHLAHLEGCIIHDHALVGSGSIILHNAVIHSHALVGAAAMVPGGTEVPPRAMALGVPARIRPDAVPEHHAKSNADAYVRRGAQFADELRRLD